MGRILRTTRGTRSRFVSSFAGFSLNKDSRFAQDLVAWYPAAKSLQYKVNAATEPDKIIDASGNDHHGLWNNSSATEQMLVADRRFGQVIDTGTSAERIELPDLSAHFGDEGTFFCWLKNDFDPPTLGARAGGHRLGSANDASNFPWTDGVIYDSTFRSAQVTCGNPSDDLTEWWLLTVTNALGSGGWKCFVNGVEMASATGSAVALPTIPLISSSSVSGRKYEGQIGDYGFASRAWSPGDVFDFWTPQYQDDLKWQRAKSIFLPAGGGGIPVSAARSSRYEAFRTTLSGVPVLTEAVMESNSGIGSPIEAMVFTQRTLQAEAESLVTGSAIRQSPMESLTLGDSSRAGMYEGLATLAQSTQPGLESMVLRTVGGSPAFESPAGVLTAATTPWEFLASTVAVAHAVASAFETLRQLAVARESGLEQVVPLVITGATVTEALVSARVTGDAATEGLVTTAQGVTTPILVLQGLARGVSGNLESLTPIVIATPAALEIARSIAQGNQAGTEALVAALRSLGVAIEADGGVAQLQYEDLSLLLSGDESLDSLLSGEVSLVLMIGGATNVN